MQISCKITDAADANKHLELESAGGGKVKATLSGITRTVKGSLIERGAQNAQSVAQEALADMTVTCTVREEGGKSLSIENHPADRALVVVRLESAVANVNGRELALGARNCST